MLLKNLDQFGHLLSQAHQRIACDVSHLVRLSNGYAESGALRTRGEMRLSDLSNEKVIRPLEWRKTSDLSSGSTIPPRVLFNAVDFCNFITISYRLFSATHPSFKYWICCDLDEFLAPSSSSSSHDHRIINPIHRQVRAMDFN